MIPDTYQEWRDCIVNDCGIALTETFIQQRLDILKSESHQETKRLVSLYGKAHLEKLIAWFTAAGTEARNGKHENEERQMH